MILISTIYEKANKSRGIKHQVHFRSRDTKELGLEPVEITAIHRTYTVDRDKIYEEARREDAKNIEERILSKYTILHKSRVDGYDGSSVSVFVCELLNVPKPTVFSEPGAYSIGPEIEWRYDPGWMTSKAMVGNSTLYVIPPDIGEHPDHWKWIVRIGAKFMNETKDTEGLCDTREEGYVLAEEFFNANKPEFAHRRLDTSQCTPIEEESISVLSPLEVLDRHDGTGC